MSELIDNIASDVVERAFANPYWECPMCGHKLTDDLYGDMFYDAECNCRRTTIKNYIKRYPFTESLKE